MRCLLIGAGASFSIKDVENGLYDGLKAHGIDTKLYLLDRRIGISQQLLNSLWRAGGKQPELRPTWPDVIYQAGVGALEMALRFEVDWVVAVSAMYLHPDVIELMRRAGLRIAVVFTESPYDDDKQARVAELVDVCWTNERTSVPYLRGFNPNTHYLRAAYDPIRHTPLAEVDPDVPSHDVVFVGTGFQERIDLLSAVDWTGIDVGLYGMWSLLPSRHKLRQYLRGGIVDNAQTVALYRAAKIGLNLHRTSRDYSTTPRHIERAESMNPRGYELAACGVFQITDHRAEVRETFGESVPPFRVSAGLNMLVRAYLDDGAGRLELAQESRHAARPHTFAARAAQVVADLEQFEQPISKGA